MKTVNPALDRARAASLAFCLLPAVAAAVEPAPSDQHQTYCVPCHKTTLPGGPDAVYTRPQRAVRSYDQLVQQVRQWAAAAGLRWSDADVARMAAYLNEQYYRF